MKRIETRRRILADPATVWAILTNPARLVAANLGVSRLEGQIAKGQRIRLESVVAPGRIFSLAVAAFEAPKRMVWSSGVPIIFNGQRSFTLAPLDGGTDFHLAEEFRGLMLPLIWRSMPDLQPSFELFADGVKRLAEESPQ